MRSRHPVKLLGAVTAIALVATLTSCFVTDSGGTPPPAKDTKKPDRPNIVVVLTDTLRADHLPFYGYSEDTAPFLSGLAKKGVVFEHCFATAGWTSPSVASLFTSLFPTQEGLVFGNEPPRGKQGKKTIEITRIPDDIETMADALKAAGYSTFAVVDNLLVDESRNFNKGFDRFDHFRYVNAENINAHLRTLREQITAGEPYFLYVHYMDPHLPYHQRQLDGDHPALNYKDGTVEEMIAAYDSEIRFLDLHVEKLFDDFDLGDETLFIFTSDHGDEFLDHGKYGHTHTLYQELIHVPLLIHYPPAFSTRRVEENVSLVDVLPTLRAYLQLEPSKRDQGVSLLPALVGRQKLPSRRLFAHTVSSRTGEQHSVIHDEWKLIHSSRSAPLLFNLRDDPAEKNSLITAHAAVTRDLAAAMVDFQMAARQRRVEVTEIPLDEETLRQLKALGYVD